MLKKARHTLKILRCEQWKLFKVCLVILRPLLLFSVVENPTDQELKDLLSEIQVMKTVGRHSNVVSLLGVSTQHGRFEIFRAYFRKAGHVCGSGHILEKQDMFVVLIKRAYFHKFSAIRR